MFQEIKYLPVHWIDGMKINEDHFKQMELSIADQARDAAGVSLNNFNYGLVSAASENDKSLDVKIQVDQTKLISADLLKCRAITRSGARIEIVSNLAQKYHFTFEELSTSFNAGESKAKSFYLIINSNPYERVPVGQPDTDEVPPRLPYTIPAYSLNILPGDQLNNNSIPDFFIPIGKILLSGGRLSVDTSYIPPCCSVRNHSLLYDYYYDFGNKLGELSKSLITIIHKIKTKSQSTSLTQNFNFMAEKVVFFTANELSRYRWIVAEQPPVHMLEYFIRFAYVLKTSLDCLVDRDKEELINYLSEWSDVNTGQFESVLTDVIRTEYNHLDISECLVPAERMLSMFNSLFGKLSQLDFIGKRKGEGSFVRERIVEAETNKKEEEKPKQKGWSFLAD
ncbi:MAG: hypothetical protein IPQ03_17095 [Bacteroidetes bacterium]|jgi:hypothetical protein|nr:hypothetical protein [Bacteroidota bacterium]MBK9523224.1 hypothetical protein [Bacteroidota bacterium]MBK9540969.1 hypothetical protein [Bacteroidota bacterium]MBL0259148.1 hypothetical protein [Bacteroidota bacterium]MBP6650664.1 hypothetical protein [Bacteroidia bacterium]